MILIFVSSLNENLKLAHTIKEQLDSMGEQSELINLVDENIPMYDSRKEENDGIPIEIENIISKMKKAKAYVFVSPEYNSSIPPVQTNAIAWISRTGTNWRELFSMKPVQLASHSGGAGMDVVSVMRIQFVKLGSFIMPRSINISYDKPLNMDSIVKILKDFVRVANGYLNRI